MATSSPPARTRSTSSKRARLVQPPISSPADVPAPSRLRELPHRASPPSTTPAERIARPSKKQKLHPNPSTSQLPQERTESADLPLFASFNNPEPTNIRLRDLAHRTHSSLPTFVPKRRKKANPESQPEPESEFPPGTVSVLTLLSELDLAKEVEARKAMPVALRRPSTTHKTRSNSNEKSQLSNGLVHRNAKASVNKSADEVNEAAQAQNKTLQNGLSGSTNTHKSTAAAKPSHREEKDREEKDREKALERNIDRVVFRDVMFKAWYPSWYPAQIIGEKALDGKGMGIVVTTLYVCKRCFGYGKEIHEWLAHCNICKKETPGAKVYTHGGEEGVWSVWEVDGGVDTIFCQNLSLFAKLFLDNKSVFFDVAGFNYFLLVHNPTSQVVGFFSKEKMSWDNNNLACILIFPPWQRKGLGSILMGVSYEISRREQILGGPEKPISDLGKKGYKMFWGREIARWLLEHKETDKKGRGVVSVAEVSRATWIMGEDCLSVLREMNVVDRKAKGKDGTERVLLDKVKIREWVDKMGLSLERVVDTDGFVEGYGIKVAEEEEIG